MTFAAFYARYPRKKKPLKSKEYYEAALKNGATHAEIMQGVENLRAEIAFLGTIMKYVPYPTTWLNGGCWLEEYEGVNASPLPTMEPASPDELQWGHLVRSWLHNHDWNPRYGKPPDHEDTRVPRSVRDTWGVKMSKAEVV